MTDAISTTPGTTATQAALTPTWYDQLAQQFGNTTSGALTNVANLSNNWYNQPLVAGQTADQQALAASGMDAVGQWSPSYLQAQGTVNSAAPLWGQATAASNQVTSGLPQAQDLWGQATTAANSTTSGLPAAQGLWDQSAAATAMQASGLPQAQDAWTAAQNAANLQSSGLPAAQSLWGQSADMLGTAAGMTQAVGAYDPAEMQRHLSPYLGGVLDEIARLGNQNLTNTILPGINQTFTGSGLFGSSRNADFTQDAIGKTQQEILGAQANAGLSAYNQAANDYFNWGQLGLTQANQYGNLGTAMGNLGTTQAVTPSSVYGSQATQLTNLGNTYAATPSNIYGAQASQYGNLGNTAAATPASVYGALSSQLGNLGNTYATTPASIYGSQAGQYGSQAAGLTGLGQTQGNLALAGQGQTWNDLTNAYGLQEQGRLNTQQGLTAAYDDWQKQLSTPYSLLGGLGAMASQFPSLYRGANTQVTANNPSQTSPLNDISQILAAFNAGGGAPAQSGGSNGVNALAQILAALRGSGGTTETAPVPDEPHAYPH